MLQKSLAAICLLLSFNVMAFECTAIDRYMDKGEYHESRAALLTTLDNDLFLKMEVEHMDDLYFITYSKEDEEALVQIVDASDDTKGIVARMSFSKYGFLSLSKVDGSKVQRIECYK